MFFSPDSFIIVFSASKISLEATINENCPYSVSLSSIRRNKFLISSNTNTISQKAGGKRPHSLFEREIALLVALQGESIWKGGSSGDS